MRVWLTCIIGGLIICPNYWAQAKEELPFWRSNKKLYKQIKQHRRIVVSVSELKNKKASFRLMGAGIVNSPEGKVTREVVQFENLMKVSSYFKKVVHKKKEQQLYLHIQALGYQSRLLLNYKWNHSEKGSKQLDWLVVWGPLKGMVGHFKFRQLEQERTEISLWARIPELLVPLPEFLMGFTLEVIAEKVAQKMRSYIEDKNRQF